MYHKNLSFSVNVQDAPLVFRGQQHPRLVLRQLGRRPLLPVGVAGVRVRVRSVGRRRHILQRRRLGEQPCRRYQRQSSFSAGEIVFYSFYLNLC